MFMKPIFIITIIISIIITIRSIIDSTTVESFHKVTEVPVASGTPRPAGAHGASDHRSLTILTCLAKPPGLGLAGSIPSTPVLRFTINTQD